jgi:hypothetical protein
LTTPFGSLRKCGISIFLISASRLYLIELFSSPTASRVYIRCDCSRHNAFCVDYALHLSHSEQW